MKNLLTEEQVESLLDKLVYEEPQLNDFSELQKEFDCEISVDIEKHNQLQYTYYYEITFNNKDTPLFVEIENGINNGTQINNVEWGISNKPNYRIVEVLKDIILDKSYYNTRKEINKAQAILDANKSKYFDYIRRNNYDNYVTGGNSNLKSNLPDIHVNYIYEEKEVDVNFI
ncbi:MAG: hypothetical protein RSD53_01450 [Algoriella sp.]